MVSLSEKTQVEHELRKTITGDIKFDSYSKLLYSTDASIYQMEPIGVVLPRNTEDVMSHPHTLHRNMRVEKDGYKSWGIPIKFSRTPGSIRHVPPKFGEHGRDILKEHGFSSSEIDDLFKKQGALDERKKA